LHVDCRYLQFRFNTVPRIRALPLPNANWT